ncbi:MAG: GyrI-like domain-containing protein [Gemmatimonadota bacterium]|nr:GyrI-like domain-containing protein [Gemmatimonadota bacterium]
MSISYTVTRQTVAPHLLAAARASVRRDAISKTVLALIGKSWSFIREHSLQNDGINVAVYRGDRGLVLVEAGARVLAPFDGVGDVRCVATPSGDAAVATHMGEYELLGGAHSAITAWCKSNGHALEGTNWEVYGHWSDDPRTRRTDVYYLLAP